MEPRPDARPRRRPFGRRANEARAWWLARRRGERLVLAASAAVILVGIPVTLALTAAALTPQPAPTVPAVGVRPSSSAAVPTATASSIATATPPAAARSSAPLTAATPAWALPPGWRHELACNGRDTKCSLHLYDEAGREQDGWPVAIGGRCFEESLAVGPKNSAFVACTRSGRTIVSGLNRDGKALAGWPVELPSELAFSVWNTFQLEGGSLSIAVGPDGTVLVPVESTRRGKYAIHALAPDGSARSGWPVALAGGAQGFSVASDGTVVAWWYQDAAADIVLDARRTVFTMLDARGRTLPGWPRGSAGAASGPIVGRDGSIYYVSASGKVWGHDRTGTVIDGWPYTLPEPIAPSFRDDGSLIFFADSRVIVLDRHGRDVARWPYRTKGTLMGPACDTPSWPYPVVATTADGSLMIASWDGTRATIAAVDPDGRTVDGWPYRVRAGWRVGELDVESDGSVNALLSGDPCGGGYDATSVRIALDGTLVGDAPATPLTTVYEALRLDGLRTSDGGAAYPQGVGVDFVFGLVNRSNESMTLPHVDYDGSSFYAAGTMQTWLERLGSRHDIGCLPGGSGKYNWYAIGGSIAVTKDPVTIPPGGPMPWLSQGSLWQELTACLPPGDYRFHVEYLPLGSEPESEDGVDETSIAIRILAGPTPVDTPVPTASPTPAPGS